MIRPVNRLEQMLALAALVVLAIGCILVLKPFLSAILWAVILCFSTWPLFMRVHDLFGRHRTLAALVMTLLAALVFVLPFAIVGPRIAEDFAAVAQAIARTLEQGPPGPPGWIHDIPIVGPDIAAYWTRAAADSTAFTADMRPYIAEAQGWLLDVGVALGQGVLQLSLSLLIAYFLYRDGRTLGERLDTALERFAGARAKNLMEVAGGTTRGVVYGILGTALAQGVLAAIGFTIVGLSGALFLGLLTFFLALVPMGPPLVWLPAAIWLIAEGSLGRGIFLLLYGALVISTIDNFLKPYFISRGGGLPFLLVFLGIIGGVAAFGFIGLFLGPVLLAIGFSLIKEWTASRNAAVAGE